LTDGEEVLLRNDFKPLQPKEGKNPWSTLSIDHTTPLHQLVKDALEKNPDSFPCFTRIAEIIQAGTDGEHNPRTGKNWGNFREQIIKAVSGDKDEFFKSLVSEFLWIPQEYAIMELSVNCSLGDSPKK